MADDDNTGKGQKPTWEKDPAGFIDNLANDPVWANRQRKEKELRAKYGLPDEPHLKDFPDHESWVRAYVADQERFNTVTGCKDRRDQISALSWSGAFDEGDMCLRDDNDASRDFRQVAHELNYTYGDSTLDEVVAEWRRRNAN